MDGMEWNGMHSATQPQLQCHVRRPTDGDSFHAAMVSGSSHICYKPLNDGDMHDLICLVDMIYMLMMVIYIMMLR